MSEKATKIPQIRFDGYTDAWEQRKLGNVAKITMGQSPNSENYTENPSDYILVQGNADMKDGRVVPRVWTTQVTKTADKGDLILSVRAPVGDIGKTDYDVVLGRGVAAIKGNEFLFQSLGRMKQNGYWTKLSTGSTFESINSNDIKEAQILLPSLEEQQKIGTFFKTLDNTITLHQRECDLLAKMKKSYLQKMFPKNGEDKPEIRFAGFTDAWEQRKLGDVFDERSERASGNEELLSVTISNGVIRQIDSEKRNIASEDKSNYKVVKKGDVPYNSMRMWQGAVGTSDYDGIVSPAYTVLIPKNNCNGKFFMELFKKQPTLEIFKRWSQGLTSDTWNLKYPVLSTIPFMIPSVKEQEKIGDYFSSLDSLITLHQRELDSLKKMKKSLLQMMFV
ncbi:Type I restriction-modification system, specificity subunit S [Streptococcus macedonicus ACA-DC 198]|nr:Type I restriction-modification system, specificity subunit S [Streptococcus macedonicus ACA-DC 198]